MVGWNDKTLTSRVAYGINSGNAKGCSDGVGLFVPVSAIACWHINIQGGGQGIQQF